MDHVLHFFHKTLVWLIAYIASTMMRILAWSWRIEIIGLENRTTAIEMTPSGARICAAWHEHVVATILGHVVLPKGIGSIYSPHVVMASRSKDGDFAAKISSLLGLIPVRGSSSRNGKDKGGKEAMSTMIKTMIDAGLPSGLTVDGPKGPRHEVKPGVIEMARLAQVPILAIGGFADRYWEFKSWDRFKIPKPFARVILAYNTPFMVAPNITREEFIQYQMKLKASLLEVEACAKKKL